MPELEETSEIDLNHQAYWKENQRLIFFLLLIWFIVSFIPPILGRLLSNIHLMLGFPLDYYMEAQGSLLVFVFEVFYYAYKMDKFDQKYSLNEEKDEED